MKTLQIKKSAFIITFFLLLTQTLLFAQTPEPSEWGNLPIGGGGFVSGIITSKTMPDLMYCRTDVGGAYRWDAATQTWIPLLDWVSENETGFLGVESIAIDEQQPNKVYMLVGISYFNSGKTAILSSNDYGATFTTTIVTTQFKAHGNGMGRQTGEKLAVDPKNSNILFCGTRLKGLWKSTNAGATWTQVWNGAPGSDLTNDNGISFVKFDTTSVSGGITQRIFFGVSRKGTDNNLYVSTNAGTSFTAVTGGASSVTTIQPGRAVIAGDTNMYITYSSDDGPWGADTAGAIWKYNIPGNTWTNISPANSGNVTNGGTSNYKTMSFGGISVDPANPDRVIASSINQYWSQYNSGAGIAWGERIFLSSDGGSTWTDLITKGTGMTLDANGISWINGNAMHWTGSIEFDPFNTSKAWVTSGNGVFSCDDVDAASTTWKFNVKGLEETVPLDIQSIASGPVISAIGDYDGFRHTDVTQYAPIHNPRMGTTEAIDYASLNPKIVVRVGSKMYYSLDTAKTWTQCSTKGSGGRVAVSADGSIFLHCPSGSSTIYRSVNKGTSWTAVTGVSISDVKPTADPVNKNKFYAYNNSSGYIMISTNGGVSFTSSGYAGLYGSQNIRCTPNKEGHVWVALLGGGLKRSINSGATFSSVSGVSSCSAIGLGKTAPGASYPTVYIWGTVSGVNGLFRSTDEGATWVRINDDAHEYGGPGNGQFVVGDLNEYGRVYMSTAGRGIVMARRIGALTNLSPVVSITSPSDGTTYLKGDNLTFTASASDPDGTISMVEFYDGNTLLGSVNSAPYDYTWTNLPAGTHQITARATDDFGVTSSSQVINVYDPVTPDCNGEAGGSAYYDNCATCVGGTTGLQECNQDCNGDWGGTAYLDDCVTCVGGNTGLTECVNMNMEAESACGYNGSLYTYGGTTFIIMKDSIGAASTWSFQSAGNQTVTLTIRYFNNGSSNRVAELFVNSISQIASINFSPGGWNWVTKDISLSLNDGNNKVKLVLLASGGLVIDKFSWNTAAVTAGSCAPVAQTISGPVNVTNGETGVVYSVTANDPNSTFTWTIPSGATIVSGQGTNSITVDFGSQGGVVQVTETNAYGDATSSATINISTTGIFSSASSVTNVDIYPNPFTEEVDITYNTSVRMNMILRIVDMKGEVVFETTDYYTNDNIKLKEELKYKGIYTIIGIYNNQMKFVKVVKQ